MSRRSITILGATGFVLVALVVILLVPTPSDKVEMVSKLESLLEGALTVLFPAVWHTLSVDRKENRESPSSKESE